MSFNASIPSIADQYPEAKALCDHTNSAANEVRTIWFGFLTYGTFLLVAAAGTTHKMLFLQQPISLPILSINLDLVGFFVAAPVLLVVLHLYLLVKLVLLSESYADFEAQVERDIRPSTDKTQIRKHLNTTIFVQALKAQRGQRSLLGILLSLVLFLTLAAGPVVALFYTEIRFLPFQSWWVTWLHRLLLAFDLIVLLGTFEATFQNRGFAQPLHRRWLVYPTSGALISMSLFITFPGEWIDANWLAKAVLPTREIGPIKTTSLDWPFPTTLKLANEQFVAEMKFDLKILQSTLSLRGRSLIGANLQSADLRKAVFDGGDLRGANFSGARLDNASFGLASLGLDKFQRLSLDLELAGDRNSSAFDNVNQHRTQLQGAVLAGAQLQGANLRFAQLQTADLTGAKLQTADLKFARLRNANLREAELQGAHLWGAELQGANLSFAQLQGADLGYTLLHGADLYGTQLQGANLRKSELIGALLGRAQLQGADLSYPTLLHGAILYEAELQGANLQGANLQGANLNEAQLQGANLSAARLQGANLTGAFVWRARTGRAKFKDHLATKIQTAPVYPLGSFSNTEPLNKKNVAALTTKWLEKIPDGRLKDVAAKRLKILNRETKSPQYDSAILDKWQVIEDQSVSGTHNRDFRLKHSIYLACQPLDNISSADIAELFAWHLHLFGERDIAFARAVLDPSCAGQIGLSDKSKARLKERIAKADIKRPETAVQPERGPNR